jgi:MSHA pilin protein MshB
MNKQKGFTLIELVIVVVILGFLAVTAIPKFLDLTDQAKQANIEGMAGGFATGVSLARAQWEAEGRPTVNGQNSVNYDGTIFYLTTPPANRTTIRAGYPVGLVTNNAATGIMTSATCIDVWQGVFQQPPTITSVIGDLNSTTQTFDYFASVSGGICAFYLKETLLKNTSGVYVAPANTSVGNNFTYDPKTSLVAVNINNS